jgi:hypothetical protein
LIDDFVLVRPVRQLPFSDLEAILRGGRFDEHSLAAHARGDSHPVLIDGDLVAGIRFVPQASMAEIVDLDREVDCHLEPERDFPIQPARCHLEQCVGHAVFASMRVDGAADSLVVPAICMGGKSAECIVRARARPSIFF